MKSGTIAGTGALQSMIDAVSPPSPTVLTLAALTAAVLAGDAAEVKAVLVVDFGNRKVGYHPGASSGNASFASLDTAFGVLATNHAENFVERVELVPASPLSTTSVWDAKVAGDSVLAPLGSAPGGRSAFAALLDAQIGLSQPTLSWSGLVGNIEDAMVASGNPAVVAPVLLIDQLSGSVVLYVFIDPSVNPSVFTEGGIGLNFDPVWTQTLAPTGGKGLFSL